MTGGISFYKDQLIRYKPDGFYETLNLSIVHFIEMEIPITNVLLFLETRNRIVWQFSKIDNRAYISIVFKKMKEIRYFYERQVVREQYKFMIIFNKKKNKWVTHIF